LIAKTLALDDKFDSVSLDWKVFLLVRLLQNSHGPQRESIFLKIKQTLTENNCEEEQKVVGQKLAGLIKDIVIDSGKTPSGQSPPQVVLLLHVWCQSHFTTDKDMSAQEIVAVGKMCLDKMATSAASLHLCISVRWTRLLHSCLNSLLFLHSRHSEGLKVPEDFLQKCRSLHTKNNCTNVVKALQARINSAAEDLSKACQNVISNNEQAVQMDPFLSFLDPIVINALEQGQSPYQSSKAAELRQRCAAASAALSNSATQKSAFNFSPYNVMPERGSQLLKKSAMSSSDNSNSTTVEVWTLQGRSIDGKSEPVPKRSMIEELKSDEAKDIADITMRELQQWTE